MLIVIWDMECILIYFNTSMLFKQENCGVLLLDTKLAMQDFEESNQLKQATNVVYMFINSQAIFKRK